MTSDRTLFLAVVLSLSAVSYSSTQAQQSTDEMTMEAEAGIVETIKGYLSGFLEKGEEDTPILQEGPPPILEPQYTPMGAFVVNLQGGKFFLKTTITLVFEDPAPKLWLDQRIPLVKDLIITQLQRLSAKKLREARVRDLLKSDLKIRVNSLFPNKTPWEDPRPVKKILFEEFYTQ